MMRIERTVNQPTLFGIRAKIKKLSKKCVQSGLPAVILEEGAPVQIPTGRMVGDVAETWTGYPITIQGPDIIGVPGHRLIAVIRAIQGTIGDQGGRIVTRIAKDHEADLTNYHEGDIPCSICQAHRERGFVLLIEGPDGRLFTAGGKCAERFVRLSHLSILEEMECFESYQEEMGGGGYGSNTPWTWSIEQVILITSAWLRKHPYVKAGSDFELKGPPTKHEIGDILTRANSHAAKEYREIAKDTVLLAGLKEQVEKTIAWVKDLPGTGDYQANLKAAIKQDVCWRTLGLVVSAVPSFLREMSDQVAKAARPDPKHLPFESGHRGYLGEFLVRVCAPCETRFGTSYRVLLQGYDGAVAVWFSSREPRHHDDRPLNIGDVVHLKGTIKEHGSYQEKPQTLVTRCEFLEGPPKAKGRGKAA